MGRIVLLVAVALALVGALIAVVELRRPPRPRVMGYRLLGEDVRFTFRARRWAAALPLEGGDTLPLRDLRVRRVALARSEADGSLHLEPMRRDEEVWSLRVRGATPAPGETLRFGFVVNDRFWAVPPAAASNRAPFPGSPTRQGLFATRPATP